MNGSGKSVFAAHMVSYAPLDRMPYILVDYKDEDLFNRVERARYLDFKDVPKEPGFYILKAEPSKDDDKVNEFLYRQLKAEKRGLIYDEGFSIPNKGAMETIYMQGRSKHVPVITLTQRPSWLTRYAFTENSYLCYFRLTDKEDQKTIKRWLPDDDPVWNFKKVLPKYWARWYDNQQNASFVLKPAPDAETILERFDDKLHFRRKVY
jgi:hypothetical protein